MLTDEELAELEAAVVMFDGSISSIAALGISTMVEFTRDQIARERAMRKPLTAEICERLGMNCGTIEPHIYVDTITGTARFVTLFGNGSDRIMCQNPTVGQLFAAAKLAGVELDWRKVGE